MKLFDKYNRLNITATIITFVIGSCTFYFLLSYVLINELDETLQTEQQEIMTYAASHNALPEIIPTKDQYISYAKAAAKRSAVFATVKNSYGRDEDNVREIQFTVSAGGNTYLVKVAKPLEETESLLQVIIGVTVAMIGLILLIGYLINRTVIRRLWKPFYHTISKVQNYHVTDQEALRLESVDITEFSLLNQSINEMVGRIQQDYSSLKNFTGQAAHEMQTPLAVIRTRLDMLVQNEHLLQGNAVAITDIEKAVHRLSRLHQSLLLLTKMENRQFVVDEEVQIDRVIEDKWVEYAEMAQALQLKVIFSLKPMTIIFHPHLAEILVSNLLNNAIRYNKKSGMIEIALLNDQFTISNSSPYPPLDTGKLFKRFYRGHQAEEGTGLGLSIVKQICDVAKADIIYEFRNERHNFTVTFDKEKY